MERPTFTCERCGCAFWRKKRVTDARRFCSHACGNAHVNAKRSAEMRLVAAARFVEEAVRGVLTVQRRCDVCAVAFEVPDDRMAPRRRLCSAACRAEDARRKGRNPARPAFECKGCGQRHQPRAGMIERVFCSRRCAKRATAKKRGPQNHEGRAKRAGVPRRHNVHPLRVFARDKWRCQLCGVATPKRLRGTCHDRAPELDHIVPLSAGGAHTYDNVQCACRRCNNKKGSRWAGQVRIPFDFGVVCHSVTGGIEKSPRTGRGADSPSQLHVPTGSVRFPAGRQGKGGQ